MTRTFNYIRAEVLEWFAIHFRSIIKNMSTQNDQKIDLLSKTAAYYRLSIANYGEFVKKERKPRTKKQLEQRLQVILNEIDSLKPTDA